ncbi:MAG TPA: serine/threonine-protein kinase [Polyangiaceae bacterium]
MSAARARSLPGVGTLIAGKYQTVRILGEGGMGCVYEAKHVRLGQRVALKFLQPRLLDDNQAVGRFEREARNASALRSAYTARIFDVDQTPEGVPFMVCELLEGRELYTELKERGPLPIEEAIDYVVQACVAMAEAHALGIVHRDLKPSNLFLARQGKGRIVKVLDFGISKGTGGQELELTTTGVLVGSPKYMSPEQVNGGRNLDARADIWSLGVIAYHALCAGFPFEGENLTQTALAIVTQPPRSLRERRPEVSEELEQAIFKALEKSASDRWATVGDLARALLPFASGRMQANIQGVHLSSAPPPAPIPVPIEEDLSGIGLGAARGNDPEGATVGLTPDPGSSYLRSGVVRRVSLKGIAAIVVIAGLATVIAVLLLRPGSDRVVAQTNAAPTPSASVSGAASASASALAAASASPSDSASASAPPPQASTTVVSPHRGRSAPASPAAPSPAPNPKPASTSKNPPLYL